MTILQPLSNPELPTPFYYLTQVRDLIVRAHLLFNEAIFSDYSKAIATLRKGLKVLEQASIYNSCLWKHPHVALDEFTEKDRDEVYQCLRTLGNQFTLALYARTGKYV